MLNLLCCSFTGQPQAPDSQKSRSPFFGGPSGIKHLESGLDPDPAQILPAPPTDFEPITLELGLALDPRPAEEIVTALDSFLGDPSQGDTIAIPAAPDAHDLEHDPGEAQG
jgi:hypothetical protein